MFYYLTSFSGGGQYFFGKNYKKPSVKGYDCFEGKSASGDKNQYNLFCRK